MTLRLRVPKYHCRRCNRYFRHSFVGIRPRFRASEAYRLEVFEAHDGGVTQRKLSRTHNISPATVERWYQYHIGVLGIFPRKRTKTAGALVILGLPEGVTSHFLTVLEYFG